ncbi:MAG: tRNA lysidine(34) synthetase TilS [Acidobacteriota bacterium]
MLNLKVVDEKFRNTIKKYNLLSENDLVIVGLSGGPDSVALLHLLLDYKKTFPIKIYLCHVNHKLRGKESEDDEEFVKEIARSLNLSIKVFSCDVKRFAKEKKVNLEEAGRILRYDFFYKLADEIKAQKIALGHNLNDQAETFLIRVLRGSGLTGLSSIFPVSEGSIIRPLIELSREEIEFYLKEKTLSYRLDKTNLDVKFLRNRIRHELIPYLQRDFGKKLISNIAKAAEIIREENELNELVEADIYDKVIDLFDGSLAINLEKLISYSLAAKRRIVRRFLKNIIGSLRRISFKHVEDILNLKKEKEIILPGRYIIRREGNYLFNKTSKPEKINYSFELNPNEKIYIKELGFSFHAELIDIKNRIYTEFDDRKRVYLDFDKISFPIHIRNRENGDRYKPLGAYGKRFINEIFREKSILPRERDKYPIFLSENEIIWVFSLPVSENFKITEKTKKILKIELIKI